MNAPQPPGRHGSRSGQVLTTAWLALVWVALWGDVEMGTVLVGVLLGAAITAGLRGDVAGGWGDVRASAALRYAATFAGMLVQATYEVVLAVIRPRRIAPAVVEVDLPATSPGVLTLVANSITLTPGTITLDAVRTPEGTARLIVHALDASDPGAVRSDALRLHRLASAAFGPGRERT